MNSLFFPTELTFKSLSTHLLAVWLAAALLPWWEHWAAAAGVTLPLQSHQIRWWWDLSLKIQVPLLKIVSTSTPYFVDFFVTTDVFYKVGQKNATKMFQMKGEGFWIMFKETADLVTVGVPNIYLFFTYIMDLFSSKIWNWTRCVGVGRILIWGVVGL